MLRAVDATYVHGRNLAAGAGGRRASPPPAAGAAGPAPPAPALPGVQGVTMAIDRGRIVGILGPNGSGKTTLLRLLAGMLKPDAGTVTLEGRSLASIPRAALARSIAVVPQETHLAFDYSVLEIALMGRYPHLGTFQLEGPRDLAVAREALVATGTASLERRRFSTLSGGEKQRVVIASALAQEAEILLLDEPTASLDVGSQFDVSALLARLNRDRGLTIVVATHDLNFAAALCGSLVMLSAGRLIASGPTGETLTSLSIQALYGVVADVYPHRAAGHLTVVPLRRIRRD
ncbi:MAG TPA: ABC transporter ATP-binding protein [Vicinamibacterales bacterium]|nr:ABC transporter ATP-binding protein [Vicinamibacterales bacterium]HPW19315.1 ABC transporter ATP-binding protein [Vicinamibacterales bacterium]